MASSNNYINYISLDDFGKGKSLSNYKVVEYRFRINADQEIHKILNKDFKTRFKDLSDFNKILNIEYYTYIKEEV